MRRYSSSVIAIAYEEMPLRALLCWLSANHNFAEGGGRCHLSGVCLRVYLFIFRLIYFILWTAIYFDVSFNLSLLLKFLFRFVSFRVVDH